MEKIRFLNNKNVYDGEIYVNGTNVLSIRFLDTLPPVESLTNGFELLNENNGFVQGDYSSFTTIYRTFEEDSLLVELSDDGSVYIPPVIPEPEPEPEPYVPTLEETKWNKKQEIRQAYQMAKAAGVDVELSTGKEHFPLSDEDITFLMGKQFELASGNSGAISYQDSENRCKFYSREDMQSIIQCALQFVNYQTTYRNNLCEWVDWCGTKEEVETVVYGCDIPEQYQNDVYKSYLLQIGNKTA